VGPTHFIFSLHARDDRTAEVEVVEEARPPARCGADVDSLRGPPAPMHTHGHSGRAACAFAGGGELQCLQSPTLAHFLGLPHLSQATTLMSIHGHMCLHAGWPLVAPALRPCFRHRPELGEIRHSPARVVAPGEGGR
jgi:hypothetical protein